MKKNYQCSECGREYNSWFGVCMECSAWGTIAQKKQGNCVGEIKDIVLEKGLVVQSDSSIVLYGIPGIGKTTLALKWCKEFSGDALYLSTEQNIYDIRRKLEKNHDGHDGVFIHFTRSMQDLVEKINASTQELIVIDSLQGISAEGFLCGKSRGYYQKEFLDYCITYVKEANKTIVLTSYVNKEGMLRGSRELEHVVDVVLNLKKKNSKHILEICKNRYGAAGSSCCFLMNKKGKLANEDTIN